VVGNHTTSYRPSSRSKGGRVLRAGQLRLRSVAAATTSKGDFAGALRGARYLGYELIPTHVDKDGRVHIAVRMKLKR